MSFDSETGKLDLEVLYAKTIRAQEVKEFITGDDAGWALTCTFLILTMQTGFGMLECGYVSHKNVANILVKNVVDVTFGGFSYWIFGYAFSFGHPGNSFCGLGDFFFRASDPNTMGSKYAKYFFQFSFATTATTIVSGAVAERMKLKSYMVFSFFNTLIYCFPASWIWNKPHGFLYKLHFFDFAGSCAVHVVGGTSALVGAWMLVTAMVGLFMLWWAWLGFNCGSTFGISDALWKVTALVAVNTLNGSIGGGLVGILLSMIVYKGCIRVDYIITSVLAGLVSVTGLSAVTDPMDSVLIGAVGAVLALLTTAGLMKIGIDDPVSAISVHFSSAVWGTLAVGLFGHNNIVKAMRDGSGLFYGGGAQQLLAQAAGCTVVILWSGGLTIFMLFGLKLTLGIRLSEEDEILGADWTEHGIRSSSVNEKLRDMLWNIPTENLNQTIMDLRKRVSSESPKTRELHMKHGPFAPDTANRTLDVPIAIPTPILVTPGDSVENSSVLSENKAKY